MSTAELERVLEAWRAGTPPPEGIETLSVDDALAYRNAGNLPDDNGRSLRLVLHVDDVHDLTSLERKRLVYEPDFHDAPNWRRAGSKPVNVVPLRRPDVGAPAAGPWWNDAAIGSLEAEWQRSGAVDGVRVPAELRGFVYKTVVALHAAGRPVTVSSIADSIARWVPAAEAQRIRDALSDANPPEPSA